MTQLLHMHNPFDGRSIFSSGFKEVLNEMAEMSQWVAEYRESVQAKLLEVPRPVRAAPVLPIQVGIIESVTGGPNATYGAKSQQDPSIAVGSSTIPSGADIPPDFRPFDDALVNFDPASVDDPCLLILFNHPQLGETILLHVFEKAQTLPCA